MTRSGHPVSALCNPPADRLLKGAPLVILTAASEALGIDGEDALRGPHSSGIYASGMRS
jgi:hypothetical protein